MSKNHEYLCPFCEKVFVSDKPLFFHSSPGCKQLYEYFSGVLDFTQHLIVPSSRGGEDGLSFRLNTEDKTPVWQRALFSSSMWSPQQYGPLWAGVFCSGGVGMVPEAPWRHFQHNKSYASWHYTALSYGFPPTFIDVTTVTPRWGTKIRQFCLVFGGSPESIQDLANIYWRPSTTYQIPYVARQIPPLGETSLENLFSSPTIWEYMSAPDPRLAFKGILEDLLCSTDSLFFPRERVDLQRKLENPQGTFLSEWRFMTYMNMMSPQRDTDFRKKCVYNIQFLP